ncbi:MAG: hypothetical protein LBC35_04870 [Coriobacteriales bacterium]|nr:hypothetical protein [Coriobacteriales bacterium]
MFNGVQIRGDAPGNILYGYLGKSFWISEPILIGAPGLVQESEHWPFDDPEDTSYILMGFDYYNQTHR